MLKTIIDRAALRPNGLRMILSTTDAMPSHSEHTRGFAASVIMPPVVVVEAFMLMRVSAALLGAARLHGLVVPDQRLARPFSAAAAKRHETAFAHRLAQAMRREPRGIVLNTKNAMNLIEADSLFAGIRQVGNLQLFVYGYVGRSRTVPPLAATCFLRCRHRLNPGRAILILDGHHAVDRRVRQLHSHR